MNGTVIYWIVLVLGIMATILFLVVRVKKGGIPGLVIKAIASTFFIGTACAALAANRGGAEYGLLILLGLTCGLLGDIWLDLKYVYVRDGDAYLYAGFYSFLVGHLFFIAVIFMNYEWTPMTLLLSIAPALIGAIATMAMEKPMKLDYGKFRPTCFIYGFILMMVTSSSIVAAVVTGDMVWIVMSIGGVLFLLSDLMLSATYFGQDKNATVYVVINHVLYYAAQFVIASSLLFL